MTKPTQFTKNMDLSEKLAEYIATNPEVTKGHPSSASYVVFSVEDESLNKMNEKMIGGLVEEGAKVVKAEKTNSRKEPWRFIVL